ncbi:MAG: hypothetical protein Ct9H300mP21_07650 [Pseudomonadota bacterium]|nr:MAG: hypothetical protein Ct9H300mP21_07650 [Pseudomonadota bacterium]
MFYENPPFFFIRGKKNQKRMLFCFYHFVFCLSSSTGQRRKTLKKIKKDFFLSQSLKLGKKPVQSAIFSPNDQQVVILSGSSTLEIFKIQNGRKLREFPVMNIRPFHLSFMPEESWR